MLRSEANMFYTTGRPESANSFTVDGINANLALTASESVAPIKFGSEFPQTAAGGLNAFISREGVGLFDVEAWVYNADRAITSGKQIFAFSKNGSNRFRGTLFENFGNSALDANDWFANSRGLKKSVSQANSFGGSLGSAIKRDTLFFFLTYEGLQLRQGSFALTDVPSLNARQNAPSNIKSLLDAFPLPNGAARNDDFAEFASTYTTPATSNIASLRLDYQRDRVQINGRYNYANSYALTRGNDGFSLNTLKRTDNQVQTVTGKALYAGNNLVVESLANYSRVTLGQSYHTDNFGGAKVTQTLFANGFDFSKYDLYGRNAAIASSDKISGKIEQLNFSSHSTFLIESHTLKFGGDYRRLSLTTGTQPNERSVLFNGISGALNGLTARTNFFTRLNQQELNVNEIFAYIQDQWKINPQLTLIYGMRWHTNIPISSNENQKPIALLDTNLPFNITSNNATLWESTYNNFAPRIGVTYALDNSQRNIIRAGIGWYYDNANTNAVEIFGNGFPFSNGTVAFNQPFSQIGQNQTQSKTFVGYDPNLKLPYARQWSVSFMREISDSLALTATYQATQGKRLLLTKTFVNQDPQFDFARLTTNEGESDYKAFQLRLQQRFSRGFSFLINYNFTKSVDNYSPDSISKAIISTPQQDRGFSDFDTHHSLNGYVTYSTPDEFENKLLSHVLSNWSLAAYLSLRSAMPINVVYGRVNDFGISYLRPDVIQSAQLFVNNQINPTAFSIPATERQGTLSRNVLRSFPFYQVDLGVSRKINISQGTNLTFRVGIINLFNHTNFAAPSFFDLSLGTIFPNSTFLPNSTFGQTSSLASIANEREIGTRLFSSYQPNASRSLQFSVRFDF